MNEETPTEREHGTQPLLLLMQRYGLSNHDLVDVSTEQLTHKQVTRACQGRQLTLKMMQKVARALNVVLWNKLKPAQKELYFEYLHKHLFNYAKGFDAQWVDPNENLFS